MFTWTCWDCKKKIISIGRKEVIHTCHKTGKKVLFTEYTRRVLKEQ